MYIRFFCGVYAIIYSLNLGIFSSSNPRKSNIHNIFYIPFRLFNFFGRINEKYISLFHLYLLNRRQLSGSLRRVDTTPQNFNWSSLSHHHHLPLPPLPSPHTYGIYTCFVTIKIFQYCIIRHLKVFCSTICIQLVYMSIIILKFHL